MPLISSNSFCSTSVHLNFTLFDVSSVKECIKCESLSHLYLYYFTKSMTAHTCFWVFGSVIFTMASNFLFIGRIPFQVTQKPRYSIVVCPKNGFLILHLSPFSLRFYIVSSIFSKWSYQLPLVIMSRSSMYTRINSNPWNLLFIFYWKFSEKLQTPIIKNFYL